MARFINLFGLFTKKKESPKEGLFFCISCDPGNFNVTYVCPNGKLCSSPMEGSTWEQKLEGGIGDYYYCSAQANNKNANLHVAIRQNGRTIKEYSNQGDFVRATVSGSLPSLN
jgi:hypothetical protein